MAQKTRIVNINIVETSDFAHWVFVHAKRGGCVVAVPSFRQVCLMSKLDPVVLRFRFQKRRWTSACCPAVCCTISQTIMCWLQPHNFRPANIYTTASWGKLREKYKKYMINLQPIQTVNTAALHYPIPVAYSVTKLPPWEKMRIFYLKSIL